jgi:uroporphyrinogen decarboxylase
MRGKKVDRTPIMLAGDCALARYAVPDMTFQFMIEENDRMQDIIFEDVLPKLPEVDMLCAVANNPKYLGLMGLAKTFLPGKELDANAMWQPAFEQIIQDEDYDFIIDKGWAKFNEVCLSERLKIDMDDLRATMEAGAANKQRFHDAGYPFMTGGMMPSPFDSVCLGRGIMNFYIDLIEIPEKLHAVFDVMMDEFEQNEKENIRKNIEATKALGEESIYTVIPCVHASNSLVSREIFEEFGWPMFERQTNMLLELGSYIFFHMDTKWDDVLDFFTAFPPGRCMFDSDGGTDIRLLNEVLGKRMAITGNIAPDLMAFGTPDQVYEKCRGQIAEFGNNYILAPSCTLPANTPAANIDALYRAGTESK